MFDGLLGDIKLDVGLLGDIKPDAAFTALVATLSLSSGRVVLVEALGVTGLDVLQCSVSEIFFKMFRLHLVNFILYLREENEKNVTYLSDIFNGFLPSAARGASMDPSVSSSSLSSYSEPIEEAKASPSVIECRDCLR